MPVPDASASTTLTYDTPHTLFNNNDFGNHQGRGLFWLPKDPVYKSRGWSEHILPDNSVYYSHNVHHIVTEADLRNSKKLESVTEFLDQKRPSDPILPPHGWELWLRDNSKLPYEFIPVRCWISHRDRLLTLESPTAPAGEAAIGLSEDDREYLSFLSVACPDVNGHD